MGAKGSDIAPGSGCKKGVQHVLVTIGLPFSGEPESYFKDAVRSVFAQAYADWELLLVGDGPDPRLIDLASSIKDSRVRLSSHEESVGLATRLNEIARSASGELLYRMDADDLMHPARLGIQTAFLLNHPEVDLVGSGAYVIDDFSNLMGRFRRRDLPRSTEGYLGATPIVHPSVVARREWFIRHPYDEQLARSQDKDLWLSSVNESVFHQLSQRLLYYRIPRRLTYRKYASTSHHERVVIAKHGPVLVGKRRTSALLARSVARQAAFGSLIAMGKGDYLANRRCERLSVEEWKPTTEALKLARSQFVPGWQPGA